MCPLAHALWCLTGRAFSLAVAPPAQFFTIILAWITGILGIVTLIYGRRLSPSPAAQRAAAIRSHEHAPRDPAGVGAQVVALGAPAAAVVAGGAMASAVNDIASNPIGMPRGSCSPPAGVSPGSPALGDGRNVS